MPAQSSTPLHAHRRAHRSAETGTVDEAPPVETRTPETGPARGADWLTAAVVFAILGGCLALWLADLSLVSGALAAAVSGVAGILFAEV